MTDFYKFRMTGTFVPFDRLRDRKHRRCMTVYHETDGVQHVFFGLAGKAENQVGDYVDGWRCLADTVDYINVILICVTAVYELPCFFITGLKAEFYLDKAIPGDFAEAS